MSTTAKNTQELELLLEFSPINEETKQEVIKASEKFFEFLKFLEDKYPNVRSEILEARMNMYMQSGMINNEAILEAVASGNLQIAGTLVSEYAKMEGYTKCEGLENSFNTFVSLFSE